MTLTGWRRGARASLIVLATVALGLGLSGCVYLRLLELKHQFAEFDRYFTVQEALGLRLNCLQPVVLTDDIRFLGFQPAAVRKLGTAQEWHIRWLKEVPPGVRETATYEIAFDLYFSGEKFTALHISENYFAFVPKPVVVAALRSLGGARVDRGQRNIQGNVSALAKGKIVPPTRAGIQSTLGLPTARSSAAGRETLHYRFISDDPGAKGRNFDLQLVFDEQSGFLLETNGRLPVGSLQLKFDSPPATLAP